MNLLWSFIVNRFELKALGCLMYGNNQWKSELSKRLGFSQKSHTLDRLLNGEYEIKQGIFDDVIDLFFEHHKIVMSAEIYFCFLGNKNKQFLDEFTGVTILDCNGIYHYNSLDYYGIDNKDFLLLNNLKISNKFNIEPFINYVLKTIKKDEVFEYLNEVNNLFKNKGILYKNGKIFN